MLRTLLCTSLLSAKKFSGHEPHSIDMPEINRVGSLCHLGYTLITTSEFKGNWYVVKLCYIPKKQNKKRRIVHPHQSWHDYQRRNNFKRQAKDPSD
jgi:hypothetical protein